MLDAYLEIWHALQLRTFVQSNVCMVSVDTASTM